jgi:tripartite-type tricarboxylate transporter receptor subunit TctC
MRRFLFAAVISLAGSLSVTTAFVNRVQAFPTKSITLAVNFAPGGGTDYEARVMARLLPKYLGVPVIVQNVPGGAGAIGASLVYRSKPDGHTMLISTMPHFLVLPGMVREVPYQVHKFEWLAKSSGNPLVLVVSAKSPLQNFKEFVAEARKRPLHHGAGDVFSVSFTPTILLGERLGLRLPPVLGYLGAAPIAVALVRGELDFAVLAPATWRPHVLSGDVRGLLVMGTERVPAVFPDVPTALELGYAEVASLGMTYRMYAAPPGTPKDRVKILSEALAKAAQEPAFIEAMERAGLTASPVGPEGTRKLLDEAAGQFKRHWDVLKPHMVR